MSARGSRATYEIGVSEVDIVRSPKVRRDVGPRVRRAISAGQGERDFGRRLRGDAHDRKDLVARSVGELELAPGENFS